MTKLLYIPTGTYITWVRKNGSFTEVIEEATPYVSFKEYIKNGKLDVLKWIMVEVEPTSAFAARNKLPLNYLESEFEIIND